MDEGLAAILSRDVAYYLLNAPSVDAATTPREARRRRGKYHHFGLRCVDAFILFDRLYYDYTVPNPFDAGHEPYWGADTDVTAFETRPRTPVSVRFSHAQLEFYRRLQSSDCVRPLELDRERFDQVVQGACSRFRALAPHLREVWEVLTESVPSFDRRFYTNSASGLLEEESIFYADTHALVSRLDARIHEILSEIEWKNPRGHDFIILAPWIFAAVLCNDLQSELGISGVYSTFSYPYCLRYLGDLEAKLRDLALRSALRQTLHYYRRLVPLRVSVRVPSFSTWCQATGQSSEGYSNMEILDRALELRANRHVAAFRLKLRRLADIILATELEDPYAAPDLDSVTKELAADVDDLIASLRTDLGATLRKSVLVAAVGAPLALLNPIAGAAAGVSLDVVRRFAEQSEQRRTLGWLMFLHEEISGYPLESRTTGVAGS